MAAIHVEKNNRVDKKMESIEDRLSSDESASSDGDFADEDSDGSNNTSSNDTPKKSGMANVISRILSKDTSKSNRALLAKGKTNKEIQDDITRRRQKKVEEGILLPKIESEDQELSLTEQRIQEEKRRLWDKMSRKAALEMDASREIKLRRIATQGMVQLFQSVHDHQKSMNEKIASVGSSDRKKDKVMAEFNKKRFLDVLKSKSASQDKSDDVKKEEDGDEAKWKILQDDFMMGATMKDWDKEDDSESDDDDDYKDEPMSDDDMSD